MASDPTDVFPLHHKLVEGAVAEGTSALRSKDQKTARALFTAAHEATPAEPGPAGLLALSLSSSGAHDEAIEVLARALEPSAGTIDEPWLRAIEAVVAARAGDRTRALAAAAIVEGAPWAHHLAEAIDALAPSVEGTSPVDGRMRALLEHRIDEALAGRLTVAEALGLQGSALERMTEQGLAMLRDGDLDDARRTFEALIVLDPRVPASYLGAALTASVRGELDAARAAFDAAVAAAEALPDGAELVAHARMHRGLFQRDHGEATDDLSAALSSGLLDAGSADTVRRALQR